MQLFTKYDVEHEEESFVTGKENFKRAIEFKGPAYLPCTIGANLDWLYDKDEGKRNRVRELSTGFPCDMLGVRVVIARQHRAAVDF